jgi:hypothetical protein
MKRSVLGAAVSAACLVSMPAIADSYYNSCSDILSHTPSAQNGIYEIDPDGTCDNKPFSVYCDMSSDNGGWTLIFRQDADDPNGGYFSESEDVTNVNQDDPNAQKYSILNKLGAFNKEGKFQFRITWPGHSKKNIWSQTSNPNYDVDVAGYQAISVDSTSNLWGGLELGNGSHGPTNKNRAYIDGEINTSNWNYAIASYQKWGGAAGCYNGIPASNDVTGRGGCGVQVVQLWVK